MIDTLTCPQTSEIHRKLLKYFEEEARACFSHLQRWYHHRKQVDIEREGSMSISVFLPFSPCDIPTINTTQLIRSWKDCYTQSWAASPCSPIRLDMLSKWNHQHPVLWKPQIKSRYKAQGCPWLAGTERSLSHTEMVNLTVHPMKKNKQEMLCSKAHKACLLPCKFPTYIPLLCPYFLFSLCCHPHAMQQ